MYLWAGHHWKIEITTPILLSRYIKVLSSFQTQAPHPPLHAVTPSALEARTVANKVVVAQKDHAASEVEALVVVHAVLVTGHTKEEVRRGRGGRA